ncbi:MAG: sulfatase-like hydrolase/transferase [Opitutales bacterium]
MILISSALSHLHGASAYWSFQTDQTGASYSSAVTRSDFPNGNPTLSATGSSLANLNNFGPAYTAPDGSVWQPGKALAWNGQNGSTGNTMQVNFNASQLKDFSLRFKFRNNQTRSSGNLVNAFSSFQYNIGNGYIAIPSANLSIPNNTSWNNEWTMDLSSLSAIEGAPSVILKWTLPDFESTGSTTTQLRIDDLQITATDVPPVGALTNSTVIAITKTSNAQPSGYTYPLAIEVPSGISSTMPVAILLHGRGGNGNGMISQFRNTLDNHILIAPTGYQNSWNITEEPSDLPDIAFLRDLITQVKTYPNVDVNRIRFVGTSNGSGMTNRVFVEIDDPGIDILCPIVSQMHTGNYRNGKFYYPINEQNTGAAHGANKGYDTLKTPVTGRRVLAITNYNDPLIPYAGGPKFGSDFLHSQLSAYAIAVSQGYSGPQIPNSSGVQLYQGIHKYSYLNDQVIHIKGSADHGLDTNLKAIIKEFFNRPPPPTAPTSLIASAKSTEQINLQWNDNSNDESGFVIEKSSSGSSGWAIFKTLPADTVIASDLAVDKGETWHYRVKATRADGNSSWSTVSSTTVQRSRHLPISNYNVLFINIDDLKPMLGSFGNTTIKTPKMDQLSASSLNFTNAHCQQAICTASRASYLTGLRPDSTRVWDLNTHLRDAIPNVVTIPQHFKENGYNSHGIGKIFHGTTLAMQDGEKSFDSWEKGTSTYKYHEPGHAALEDNKTSPLPATDKGEFLRDGVTPVGDSDYSAGVIAGLAKTKLAQFKNEYENNSKPFFLGVGFYKPHLPFTAPKPYWDLYDPVTDIDLTGYDGTKKMPTGVNEFAAPYGGEQSGYSDIDEPPSEAQARRLTHAYMACVSYVDQQVGKIIDELERLGLADSTIVVLFGDHGFHLADHGAFWAKHSNFDHATRTPLIVRVPGMQKTGTFDTPVGLVDVFPTLVDLCSLPYPKQPNGLFLEGNEPTPIGGGSHTALEKRGLQSVPTKDMEKKQCRGYR